MAINNKLVNDFFKTLMLNFI